MRVIIERDAGAVAHRAAGLIADVVRGEPGARLGLPTGDTPVPVYARLERCVQTGALDATRVEVYALDEFAGVPADTPGTNTVFYRQHLRIGARVRCPDPAAADPDAHIRGFADALRRAGGLRLCVLGVGLNGHIAFNEPGSPVDSRARAVELTDVSRCAHADAFGGLDRVPPRGMTLGVADILESHRLLVLGTGPHKADIVARAIEGDTTPEVPASWLRSHPDLTWLLDRDAARRLRQD